MRILVTGATGFVGRWLVSELIRDSSHIVRVTARRDGVFFPSVVERFQVSGIDAETNWTDAVADVDVVIHAAARVHVMADDAESPLLEFRRINVDGTLKLAQQAMISGVRRFIYLSSIKVNGEESDLPYTEGSCAHPTDPYGICKWEAEQALRKLEAETGLQVVIVRPPLVYGSEVKANFLTMMKIVSRGIPLPLALIRNKRSLLYIGNLVDALTTCVQHPAAAGQTYLVSDGEDVSTPELIRRTASALGVPARLLPFPTSLMNLVGKLTGKSATVNRLTGSLTVDSSKIRRELGWTPPFTMEEGLRKTAEWYKQQVRGEG